MKKGTQAQEIKVDVSARNLHMHHGWQSSTTKCKM